MFMTDEQKYNAVLKQLGEVLTQKNTEISCLNWQIDNLKEKLAAAEKERDEVAAKKMDEMYLLLGGDAVAELRAISRQLRLAYENDGCIVSTETMAEVQAAIKNLLHIDGGAA